MIKKISRAVSFLVISIFLTTATIFSGINPGFAAGMGPEMNEDNSMSIVIEQSKDSLETLEHSGLPTGFQKCSRGQKRDNPQWKDFKWVK